MSRDPALSFWLHYVEWEGSIVDAGGGGDAPLVVLTPDLQRRFELPEMVAVTSDPDVASDDGALLLMPGHPLLDAAAARVLEEGDAGTVHLGWPRKPPLGPDQLLALARDRIGVDHGRIDLDGQPEPRFAPVLRVGAQVTYLINDRFLEREEVWVDARSGLPVPDEVVRLLHAAPAAPPDHPALEADLTVAVRSANRLLDERATARRASLARQAVPAMRAELAQAERFYAAALESIAQRRAAAAPDRHSLYDARAEATRAEQARRLEEIREKHEARHEIRPVRLHLVLLPALRVPVVVRRGARAFPFALTWWLPAARFADVRCPSCGEPSPLAAAKDRLGCRSCVERRAPEPVRPQPVPPSLVPPPPQSSPGGPEPRPVAAPAAAPPPQPRPAGPPVSDGGPGPSSQADGGWRRNDSKWRVRVQRVGHDLGHRFWVSVLNCEPWPRKRSDPRSPLGVLYRLYGIEGPLRGIGVPPGDVPEWTRAGTEDPDPELPQCTWGTVMAGGRDYPFSLRWRLEEGKPVFLEVVPFAHRSGGQLTPTWLLPAQMAERLYARVPDPVLELDPVAEALWREELQRQGLPVVARCLAAWWRIADNPRLPVYPASVLAAALAAMVGRRAAAGRTRPAAAADHGADPDAVGAAARKLQALLELSDVRWW